MTLPMPSPDELQRLIKLAGLLMPATERLPAASSIASMEALIGAAITASAIPPGEIRTAIADLPRELDWAAVHRFAVANPLAFENLALILSGAYVMSPEVMGRLGFPADRRNPAGAMDAADEYETGILEPVLMRGATFRDPRRSG